MQFDYLRGRHSVHGRHVIEVRPEFAAIADGDFDLFRRRKRRVVQAREEGTELRLQFTMIEPQRIKLDQQRAIGGMEIANPFDGSRLQKTKQLHHALMAIERDLPAKRDKQRLVAGGSKLHVTGWFVHWLRSSGVEYTRPRPN
jgi:hypothetical protein